MAVEIDKELFDSLVKSQIGVVRYSEQQARDAVVLLRKATKELEKKIESWGESERFTPTRLKALFKELKATIDETYTEAATQLRTEMGEFAFHAGEVSASSIATQMPVTWSAVAMTQEQIAAIVDKTPIKIGQNKSLLFDEVFKSLAGGMEEKVRGAVRLGMSQGETMHEITNRLTGTAANRFKDGVLEGPRRDLANLTHSIVQSVNNNAAQMTMMNNSAVVKSWVYVSTFDSKVCFQCSSHSGKTYPLGQGPIPTLHVSCRCFAAPVTRTWEELGFKGMKEAPVGGRATSSGVVAADTSFDSWLRSQPASTQREMLGPVRQKMFANGMKLDKFTDASGKTYTLDQLKSRK